jgi:hypothetical protein
MVRRAVKEIAAGRVEEGRWWMWPRYGLLTRSLGRGEAGMMSGTRDDAHLVVVVEPVRQVGQGRGSVRPTHNVQ